MSQNSPNPVGRRLPSWRVLAPFALAAAVAAGAGAYLLVGPPPAPAGKPPGAASAPKAPPGAATGTDAAAGRDPSAPGKLGIAKANCQGFADIAARFWDLKQEGRTIEFVFGTIEQNSKGDEGKARVLRALAQVVYKDAGATRDVAYRNAHEACMKQ